ncbi:MAG: hypothetical protein EZS28_028282 [Streblomastix strix]|uniref:Uncharacterized protein n=1 Tax=Streblomastix strix TaxID=222440 RepID=A0A5J4V286_9EUKA|nr:MAG: hypothetical protein EZS28_028282 [Streblomastix strix]
MSLQELQDITFTNQDLLNEYKTKPLTKNSLFLINGNHYIVGAVGSGKTTLMCKLVVIYKKIIDPFILYFSNQGADETIALNLNSKNIQLTNVTYGEAMIFLPEFDEIKYSTKEMYTWYKMNEQKQSYTSDFIKRMEEQILQTNEIKKNEKPNDYLNRIAELFKQKVIETINTYSQPTKILRFDIPALIQNVTYQKKFKITDDAQNADIKIIKIPILEKAQLLHTLMLFDDIGSNADIQRFSSQLSKTITHLVSDSRHSKNTIFFIAQRPTYLFKTARILTHVICLGVNLGETDLRQVYDENTIQNLDFDEFQLLYNTLKKYEFIILNKWLGKFEILKNK